MTQKKPRERRAAQPGDNASSMENVLQLATFWPMQWMNMMMMPWSGSAAAPQVKSGPILPKSTTTNTDESYGYTVELPGIHKRHISLEIDDNTIMLIIDLRQATQEEQERFHCRGVIRQAFPIPVYTDGTRIDAALEKGVLTITIPKTQKPSRPKTHNISVG